MLHVVSMDITTVERGIIAHVCNNKRVMGAGVAKALYTKWPIVRNTYMVCSQELGTCSPAVIHDDLIVVNMIAQDGYGRDGKCYLQYHDLRQCLKQVAFWSDRHGIPVYVPFNMGCGLAGGRWEFVTQILEAEIPDVIVCRK